ncbi:hypothetical protein [Paraburkholderia terrae]|uniref:Uncharacterized protein n=1 Tax=Paraburkholderia terrae TaxID=311230 RepID=A0A2I8EZU0_9BURK|nr:hypothetical protein [Paraburkholderia terrae]AUT64990.1 hypothetical protein C2L65_35965 [Paraburkholderia terrae]
MTSIKKSSPVLREVLIQFSVEQDTPDQQLLDYYVEKYPQFESQLRSLASQLMDAGGEAHQLEGEAGSLDSRDIEEATVSVSVFQSRYFDETGCVFGESRDDAKSIENRLSSLERPAYRNLASRLGINTLVLNQLRDREIDSTTVSRRFTERLARELNASVEVIRQFLSLPAAISPMASFKAEGKPQNKSKESFEEALMHSGLNEEQIRSLLD